MRASFLEYISSAELHPGITCEWEVGYKDYDGSWSSFECGEMATVWMTYWDGYEWIAVNMCRPHGNLAMISERSCTI